MMSWQLHQLRFRLLSPLHVGRNKVGNIQFTRPYVMARQMWAAVTVRLTRSAQNGEWTPPPDVLSSDYDAIGNWAKEYLAFTYLYPEDESGKPLFPWFTDEGLRYGADKLTAEDFAWRYLNSYPSTALNYELNSAEEGTLHETEFLAPHTRKDDGLGSYDVFFTGYVFVKLSCSLPWKAALREIQIGGERKSGWGRMRLCKESAKTEAKLFDFVECDLKSERPKVNKINLGKPLLAHARIDKSFEVKTGDIEPLVSRAWEKDKGAGQKIEFIAVCYSPGSVLKQPQDGRFQFCENNLWAVT